MRLTDPVTGVKRALKSRAPRQYWWTVYRIHRGKVALDARTFKIRRRRDRSGAYAVDIEAKSGFFAALSDWLAVHHECERNGHLPSVNLTSGVYGGVGKGADWFSVYFETAPTAAPTRTRVRDVAALRLTSDLCDLSAHEARALFDRHATVRSTYLDKTDALLDTMGIDPSRTIAVHYRGTDKFLEADRVDVGPVTDAVHRELEVGEYTTVLVASDDVQFADRLRTALAGADVEVVPVPASQVGDATTPPHMLAGNDTYLLGEEALVTCLVLSRCATLIRTASYLSGWCKVFNPSLPTTTLNRANRGDTFPDAVILREEQARGRP